MLETGQTAASFTLNDQNGMPVSLSQFKGKKVVLYFYPKDDTPGCTVEAIDFTAKAAEFQQKNTVVLGISKDSVASHQKFCEKHRLGISLLSDPDGTVLEAYGVWQEKKNYGKTYMGIVRSTFLIDETGIIQKGWKNVKVEGHAQAVLNAL